MSDDEIMRLESSITAEEREKFLAILTGTRIVPSFEAGSVRPNGVQNTGYRSDDTNVRAMSNIYEEIHDVETGSENETRYSFV